MARNAGMWIDHREARVVFLSDAGEEEVKRLESGVEKHVRSTGGHRSTTPSGSQGVAAGDVQEGKFTEHLHKYYKSVIELLRDADAIVVFGPGEAKGEFQKQIKSKEFQRRVIGVETADKMTERQLVAKVRQYFQKNRSSARS